MKRLLYKVIRLLLLICSAAVIPDCAKIPELHEQEAEPDSRVSLSVEEARRYFESEYGTLSVTKTVNGEARVPWLMPGDITPMWEKAVESWKGNTASVDVEVIPTYRYRAVRSEFRNGKAEAYSVDVYQKLVVVNDLVKKEEGREQAFEVMEEQVKYYFSHPGDAVEDATYLITNFGNILDKIREYVPESAGTKSGYSPEQEVFDLLFGQLIEYYEDHVPGFSLPEIS